MEEKKLLDEALEEVHGARHYAKCAMKYRETNPEKAKRYYDMAQDELRHADSLYKMAHNNSARTELESAYINDAREHYAEKVAHVRAMLDSYRGN